MGNCMGYIKTQFLITSATIMGYKIKEFAQVTQLPQVAVDCRAGFKTQPRSYGLCAVEDGRSEHGRGGIVTR